MVHSRQKRDQFTQLLMQGISIDLIQSVHLPDVSISTLHKWRSDLKTRGNLTPLKSTGRPKKFDDRTERYIIRTVNQDPWRTSREILEAAGVQCTHKTLRKVTSKAGIQSFVALKKPKLTHLHIANRLAWATEKRELDLEAWKGWTFSDESTIELDCTEGVTRVNITRSKRHDQEFCVGRRQMGGGKQMIWSFISYFEKGPLIFIEGGLDSQGYKNILNRYVLNHCLDRLDDTGVPQLFMDDGASCHDSNLVVDFCAERGIQRPYWPANSPDMNPIEHVWGWIKMKLSNLRPKPATMAELKREIAEIWDSIELASIQKLYESMPRRVHSLFAQRGGTTKY